MPTQQHPTDIILLGTEAQVGLAAHAARELVAGRHVHTHALVVSLRDFIRQALDLEPLPTGLEIPMQGPTRPGGGGSGERERGKGKKVLGVEVSAEVAVVLEAAAGARWV